MSSDQHVVAPPAPVADRDSAQWWEAIREHRLVMQQCDDCARLRWPARAMCSGCGSFESQWSPVAGNGTIASWIVNHHPFGPAFAVPYVVLSVRLAEQHDIVLIGSYLGDESSLEIGAPVTCCFVDHQPADGAPFTTVAWALADR